MGLSGLPEASNALLRAQVGVSQDRVPLLVLPCQIADILHCDGQHGVCSSEANGSRHGGSEENVAVPGHDTSGHAGDQDVQYTRKDLLAGLFGWGEGSNGRGEGMLQAEGFGQGIVNAILGADGLLVESKARFPYLNGEAVGRCRAVGSV